MPNRHLVIIPLPHGTSSSGSARFGRLSVLLLPRLRDWGNLADWASDWARWPTAVNGAGSNPPLALSVAINGQVAPINANLTVSSPRWVSAPPDVDVWTATFANRSGPIRVEHEHTIDGRQVPWAPIYDGVQLVDQIGALYDGLGVTHIETPPTPHQVVDQPAYQAAIKAGHAAAHAEHLKDLSSDAPAVGSPMDPADPEFHEAITLLQAHPHLLRRLGLLVDLDVQLPRSPSTVAVGSNYRDQQAGTPGAADEVRLRLAIDPDFWPRAVRPAPGTPESTGFWQLLDDDAHAIDSVDPATFIEWFGSWSSPDGEHGALTEAGVVVARQGASVIAELRDRADRRHELWGEVSSRVSTSSIQPIPIDAADVAIGLRYDIFDHTSGRWFSLWEREAPDGFRFLEDPRLEEIPPGDESWMTVTAFTEADRRVIELVDHTPQRVSPVNFVWRGWSLAASPPGRAFSGELGAVDRSPNEPPEDATLQVAVDYVVPSGRLPRLRFGREYSVRARLVDYAGNSRALDDAQPRSGAVLGPHRFGRTIPLEAPVPIRRAPRPTPGRGDTVDTIVVLSDLADPGDPTSVELQADGSVTPATRLFLPPQTSVSRCELHGLPAPDGLPTDEASFRMLVQRDGSTLATQSILDANSGELVHPDPDAWRPAATYLVDPAATGVAFSGLPGSTTTVTTALGGSWPDLSGIGFEVIGGTGPVATSSNADLANVRCAVPKGVTRTVEVSSTAGLTDHWRIAQRSVGDRDGAAVKAAIENGRHWMVSARDRLTLVHATRLPLMAPSVTAVSLQRVGLDDTHATATGTYGLDVKSTSRVTMTGTWTDPYDPGHGALQTRTARRILLTESWEYAEDTTRPVGDAPFDLGDTKRHRVDVTLDAYSRYARHFAVRTEHRLSTLDPVVVNANGLAPGSVEAFDLDGRRLLIGPDVIVDHVAGTVARTRDGSVPDGARVYIDAVHAPFSRSSVDTVTIDVANAAAPDAASVHAVLPAFRRTATESEDQITVEHRANIARIWLDRPWYSTGDGELLGVIVDGSSTPTSELSFSRVGRDPLVTGPMAGRLEASSFPAASTSFEVDGRTVIAHAVHFDAERDRWYADVEIAGDFGYRPFFALSVSRFQPLSIPGAHVGEITPADPVRLGASRTVVARNRADGIEVEVIGDGTDNLVTVTVQRFDPGRGDRDLGWRDTGAVTELVRDRDRWTGIVDGAGVETTGEPLRLVVIDAEPRSRDLDTVADVSYLEVIEVPSSWLEGAVGPPPPSVPDRVEEVVATPRNRGLDVTWAATASGDGPLTGYEVQCRPTPDHRGDAPEGEWPIIVNVRARDTSARIGRLDNDVSHDVRVRAHNAHGPGPWSDTVQATPGR